MPNYPKNPVSNLPTGQKIPSFWQNRRTPFDDNPVLASMSALQDNSGSTEIDAELDLHSEVVDSSSDNATE